MPENSAQSSKVNCLETGHCKVHGVEIERRKNQDRNIDQIKNDIANSHQDVEKLWIQVSHFKAFIAQVKVIGVIALTIWAGSFVYTFQHKQDAQNEFNKFHKQLNRQQELVSNLTASQRVTDQKFISLMDKLETTNSYLAIIIDNLELNGKHADEKDLHL